MNRTMRPNAVGTAAVLLLACVAALSGCGGDPSPAADRPGAARGKGRSGGPGAGGAGAPEPKVPVVVTAAGRGDMEAFLDGSATLEAEAAVDVVSLATGVVSEILAEEGDRVPKDRELARLDYEELDLAERRARSQVERLQADFARAERLRKENFLSVEDFQKVQFDLKQAEIDWQQKKLELERTRILAPISGTVTQRLIKVGDLVRENQAVYRIVDFDSLVAPVYVPEKYLSELHIGQPAVLDLPALGGRKVHGRVKRVSPIVESQSGTIKVTVEPNHETGLRPGMFSNVQLVLDRHEGVVVLPKKSIVYEDEAPHVFVVEGGRAQRRSIALGYQDETRAEVTSGVAPGDLVVLVGQSTLKDGSPVSAEDEAGKPVGEVRSARDAGGGEAAPAPARPAAGTAR